jgi:acyl-CoA oxidase
LKAPADVNNLELLENALATRAAYYIKSGATKYALSKLSDNEKVNSALAIDLVKMAHAHIMYVTLVNFITHIKTHPYTCQKVKDNLTILARIYALTELLQDSVPLYECGFLSVGSYQHLLEAQKENMKQIRPQMIPLVEAFEMPDSYLVSAIGNSYGDIYETQL